MRSRSHPARRHRRGPRRTWPCCSLSRWPPDRLLPRMLQAGPARRHPASPGGPIPGGWCRPASPPSTRSSAPAVCRVRPEPSSAGMPRAARPRSPSAWSRRSRPRAASSPTWISPTAWIPSRRSPAASVSNGSSCSSRGRWRRPWRWRRRCSRTARWTCSCWTSRPGPSGSGQGRSEGRRARRESARPRSPTASSAWRPSPGEPGPVSWSSSRPASRPPCGGRSRSRPASASSWYAGPGSASAGMSSASERR